MSSSGRSVAQRASNAFKVAVSALPTPFIQARAWLRAASGTGARSRLKDGRSFSGFYSSASVMPAPQRRSATAAIENQRVDLTEVLLE